MQTDSGCGSVPHRKTGCWMQQCMAGEGKENYWFFLSLLGEMEDLGCLCLQFGGPEGWKLSCECCGVTVVSWSKVFCQKNIDFTFSEINVSSQCLFPEMCGTYGMHPAELHPPSIYQGPLVRVGDLSGALCIFSNTDAALPCQAPLWSAEGVPVDRMESQTSSKCILPEKNIVPSHSCCNVCSTAGYPIC